MSEFNESDVDLRSWPPWTSYGGQHVPQLGTGVLAVHQPTGIAVVVDEQRSQHGNRMLALERLKSLVVWKSPRPVGRAPIGVDGKTLMAAVDKMRLEMMQAGITIDSTAILAEDRDNCDCDRLRAALSEALDAWPIWADEGNGHNTAEAVEAAERRRHELRKLATP